jgi:integrase
MSGRKARICRKSVAALKRGDWITDDAVPGFKVRRPNRLALYGVNIRLNGRMRWISLGTEADLTPDQARAEAERIRGLKRQGIDPAQQRDRRKASPLLEDVAERFLKEHARPKLKPSSSERYASLFERLIFPRFDKWTIESLTESDVSEWHVGLASTPTQANRALQVLSSFMTWAVRHKYRETNPCRGVIRFKERAVNRYPGSNELTRIARAIEELTAEDSLNLFFAAGTKVLMMTGARRSEIFNAQWDWLDLERRSLVLPDSKTGEKVIALPQAALDIIVSLPRMAGCPWIFPSLKTDRPFVDFKALWSKVLARADVGHWRIHDLRHGFASAAVASGAPIYVIGRQLGHTKPSTTARYSHVADEPKREVVETVAGLIAPTRGARDEGSRSKIVGSK